MKKCIICGKEHDDNVISCSGEELISLDPEQFKHILVAYKGGGYDGCIWEWNFCMWDDEGEWYDIASSGYKGCRSAGEMIEMIEGYGIKREGDSILQPLDSSFDFEIFNYKSKEAMDYFRNNYLTGLVFEVAKFFDNGCVDNELQLKCSLCDCEIMYIEDAVLGGLEGMGGLACGYTEVYCSDCYCIHTCSWCGGWINDDDFKSYEDGCCEYCFDKDTEMLEQKLKDMVTVTPVEDRVIDIRNSIIKRKEEREAHDNGEEFPKDRFYKTPSYPLFECCGLTK